MAQLQTENDGQGYRARRLEMELADREEQARAVEAKLARCEIECE